MKRIFLLIAIISYFLSIHGAGQNYIIFPQLPDVLDGTQSVTLHAQSSNGAPVFFSLLEGTAEISDNQLSFKNISRKEEMPVMITVEAFQQEAKDKGEKTAEPIYRTFYIVRKFDTSLIDHTIQTWMNRGYYPGGAICIMNHDSVLFHKCYNGYSDDTPTYVASAGKWVAAATIATVVDKGKLKWNDKVSRWLKEFKHDSKGNITLLQLLSHTSGVRPYLPDPDVDNYNRLDSAIAKILPLDTIFTAGSNFQYGGLAMQIAGRMAEIAEGKSFESIFQSNIAIPLDMNRSHFTPIETSGGHSPMLAGGLCTTLHDYMAFLDMIYHNGIFNGKTIIKKSSINEMQRDQIKNATISSGEYVQKALGLNHHGIYGLGEWREQVDTEGEVYQISSPGWAGAYPWINKHDDIYGFFISHVIGSSAKDGGFSSFYGSPILSKEASEIVK